MNFYFMVNKMLLLCDFLLRVLAVIFTLWISANCFAGI